MMATFSSAHEAVAWMESVCQAFPTNPKEAEAALMELRRSEHAVEVSKTILGQSQVPMAQFHALLALQEVVLARWESVPHADRRSLKAFLWDFISREWSRLERSVASQALRTFCVFWRRGWAAETEETKLSLFALLRQGVNEGGFAALRSAKALYALVSEFGSTRATALGLPLEFFKITHAAFDKIGLDQSLALSMELLGEAVKAVADPEALADASVVELVTTAVNVCAEVLSWEFTYVEAWQIPSAQQLITPGPRWRQYLIRPDFLGVVFQVYHQVRVRGSSSSSGRSLPHSLRQLLLQLSSVHGHIFEDEDQRRAYASFLVEGTAAVLSSPLVVAATASGAGKGTHGGGSGRSAVEAAAEEEAQADEYIGIASMAMRLVSNFKLATLAPLECFGGFAQQLASLSSRMLQESAALAGQDDCLEDGTAWRDETFALLLEAWVAMADDPLVRNGKDPALRKGMEDTTFPLYEQYVAHELAVSRAEAEASVGQEEDDEEEEIGAADKDEEMCAAACLGRLSPARALATVDLQMRGVSETLACLFETGSVNGRAALLPGGLGLSPEATGVMEQSRTIIVLATHLVADKDDGDAMVPEVLHDAFLADERAADLLVQLVRSLFKVLEMHTTLLGRAIDGQGGQGRAPVSVSPLLSPYLGGALLWSLTRWASAYLLPDLTLYEGKRFSYRLTLAFGTSAPGVTLSAPPKTRGIGADAGAGGTPVREGMEVVEALLRGSWACLCAWPSQPDVCVNALDMMGVLASRTKASATTTLSLWWEIVAACGGRDSGEAGAGAGATRPQQGFRRLAADLQGMLVQRLCEGVLHRAHDTASAKDGFDKVAGPVWTRLRGLLHAVGGLNGVQRQSPRVVAECLLCVRLCRGVVVGCGTVGVSYHDLGEAFVEQTYDGMTLLLAMHVSSAQNVVHEVLQFLRDVADLLLIYMSSSRAMALYEACGKALKIYADQQAGCIRRVDPTSEEDSYDDVLCVLELLSHLVTKDLVDESDEPQGEKGREVGVTDVVFFGLKKVMPLMTEGLLQFPSLASQYFSLVGFLVQTYAHKLAALEFELFHQIVNSLVFGCQQAEASLARNSLQAITVMVTHHVAEVMKGKEGLSGHLAVKPDTFLEILRTLLHMLVFQQLVWDRLEACAQAVLPLLVCEKEGFERLAGEIVAAQPEATRPRLMEAFETLYACHGKCGGGLERLGRRRFEAGMREFVTSIRAFLQTK